MAGLSLRSIRRHLSFYMLMCAGILSMGWISFSLSFTQGNTRQTYQRLASTIQTPIPQKNTKSPVPKRINRTDLMNDRRLTVLKMCRKDATYKRSYREHMIMNKNKHFIYCKATKAGSTFWGRLLLQVDRKIIDSPYKIKPQIGPVNVVPSVREWKNFDSVLNSYTKFIIARSPLERLYSGYVDKVFSPNPYYWNVIGKHVVRSFRKRSKTSCGHDVTFTEFLQYAAHAETTGSHRDVHVASLWETCAPCNVKYDIIGKMETFKDDSTYILEKLNLDPYKNALRNVSVDAVNDALYDTAQAYVDMRIKALTCITEQQTVDRVWTKLKARGFIDAELPPPVDLYNKNVEQVLEIFKQSYSKSILKLGRDGLKRQQKTIYNETLGKVPREILVKVEKAYLRDLQMFGYDMNIDEIRNFPNNSSGFSVSDNFFSFSR